MALVMASTLPPSLLTARVPGKTNELVPEGLALAVAGGRHGAQVRGLGMGNDGHAQDLSVLADAYHHINGPAEARGGHFDGVAGGGDVDRLDHAGIVLERIQLRGLVGIGQHGGQSLRGFFCVDGLNSGGRHLVHQSQQNGHHGADNEQRQRQPGNEQRGILGFHPCFASFLGAPYFTGRPSLSSSTTQAFITRMA